MTFFTVLSPMVTLFLLMLGGAVFVKLDMLDDHTVSKLSTLIVTVFNPMLLMVSSMGVKGVSHRTLLWMMGIALLVFTAFAVLGAASARLFDKDEEQQRIYKLMFLFGNVGFIGIPVVKELLGGEYLVYVAEFNIVYCLYFYTYGMFIMEGSFSAASLKKMFNTGTIAAIATFLIVWFNIELPEIAVNCMTYFGNVSTPLALALVGVSLTKVDFKKIFGSPKLYLFSFVKLILIPYLSMLIFRMAGMEPKLIAVCVIMIGMPVGNMPLMLGTQKGMNCDNCAASIIMTTLFCLITVPILLLMTGC